MRPGSDPRGGRVLATRLAGLCGVAGPLVFAASWMTAGALTPGYRQSAQAISELAAMGAPTGLVMNGGFLGFGVLTSAFAWGLSRGLPSPEDAERGGRPRWRSASGAAAVTAVGTMLVAAFPCSPGCPGPLSSWHDLGHAVTAGTAYTTLGLTPLLAAAELGRARGVDRRPLRAFQRFSRTCGVLTLGGFALWASGATGEAGGLLQRAFTTTGHVWIAAAGAALALGKLAPEGPSVYSSGASDSSGAES